MKKLIAITISFLLIVGAAGAGGSTAYAAEENGATHYPEAFQTCTLNDYAVNGETYAFATTEKIAVFSGDSKPVYYEFGKNITALDCHNGEFCYETDGGLVYDFKGNSLDYKITETVLPVATGGYSYTIKPDGTIKTTDKDGNDGIVNGNFSNLKVFGSTVYAVNDNHLNKITPPDSAEAIAFEFADFSDAGSIKIGETVKELNTFNLEKPHFTTLTEGEYLTEVLLDGNNFDKSTVTPSDNFIVGKTYKVGEDAGFAADTSAFLLCKTGNAHIIALGGKFYIKLANDAAVSVRELSAPEFTNARINVPADYIYSSPCICEATKSVAVKWGDGIIVTGAVLKAASPEVAYDFYRVALTDADGNVLKDEQGNETVGYVPCEFVFEKTENNSEHKTDDPDPKTDNNIKTVILVLLVIVLVLTAVGYITFVFTSGKKRKDK